MREPSIEEQTELYLLSFRINYWLFWSGIFIGQALNCFGLTLLMGRVTMLTLLGIGFLAGALGSYQYRGHLKDKMNKKVMELKK